MLWCSWPVGREPLIGIVRQQEAQSQSCFFKVHESAMRTSEMAALVHRWFNQTGQFDGPLLPDGWFGGRRGEAGGSLNRVESTRDALLLYFDQDTSLRFDQPGHVFVENSELVFDGYARATLRWKHYGGGPNSPYYAKRYDSGQVRLMPPLGTVVRLSDAGG